MAGQSGEREIQEIIYMIFDNIIYFGYIPEDLTYVCMYGTIHTLDTTKGNGIRVRPYEVPLRYYKYSNFFLRSSR